MKRYLFCLVSVGFIGLLAGCVSHAIKDKTPSTTPGVVEFSVLTQPAGGRYAPRNIHAIWVTDSEGQFVKTLEVQANRRKRFLVEWNNISQANDVDAVTGATLRQHQVSTVTWDCCDTEGQVVPDGEYEIRMEMTDQNGPGPVIPAGHVRFTKGKKAQTLTPEALPNYTQMSLSYTPK